MKVQHNGKILCVYNPRVPDMETGSRYVKSLTLQLDAENEYTFAGNVYEVIHVTKGGFDTHHWAEFQLACSSVYHYDNLKRNGVAVLLEDFVSDDKIEYDPLRKGG